MSALFLLMQAAQADEGNGQLTATWNAANVVLPASQWTPSQTWQAQTMVFNTGRRYADSDYNKVWGTPPADAAGHAWYAPDYSLTNGEKTWQTQTSPFSSDEYYLGQRSSRWITADITGDIYLRRAFTLSKPVAGDLFLACGHDDAPSEFYINGVKVFAVSDGWNNDERTLLTAEQKALIKTDGSENILAVHVHQNWGGALADCGLYEADMQRVTTLLPTLAEGPWPCAYYLLNSNNELNSINASDWTGRCICEDDWVMGYGPLSNSNDQFLHTYWGSERLPLLVRRHFMLTAEELSHIAESTLELTCSYDENPKVYLNGRLIWQTSGWNDNDYAHYTLTDQQKTLLKEGDNVLAVSLTAGGGGGHIDYGLSITEPYITTGINGAQHILPDTQQTFDLQGRKLAGIPSKHGIYITNGKKIIK